MLAGIGTILVGLGLITAAYATGAVVWSIHTGDRRWWESGRNGVRASAAVLGVAVALLAAAFLNDDFTIRYVAQHSSRTLPLYLKASAVWGGQAGSLLLWASLQALFAALIAERGPRTGRDVTRWATAYLSIIACFFAAVTLFLSNPFATSQTLPVDGQGLNPLLRHPGMVFHPPAMYVGYVGLAVPFALGLAALTTQRLEEWSAAARPWTLLAWLFLGLGLLLGMRWAYDVLGWGGYWGWDPVENAGLMPWLTATGLLHALAMADERRGFHWWSLILAVLSFVLVLFGTFTTRSGLIESVHAFARSPLGPYFLGAIGVTLAASVGLLVRGRKVLNTPATSYALLSREGTFTLTLVLLLTLTGSVLIGSLLPTLTQSLAGQRFEAGPAWFDRVTGPQFAGLVFIMGVCPLLGHAVGHLRRLRRDGIPTLVGGLALPAVGVLWGFSGPVPLTALGIVGLAGGTAVAEIGRGVVRETQRGQSLVAAVSRVLGRNRRRYGGYLVHAGVVLMAIGVIGTRFFPFETEAVLAPGESTEVADYTLVFQGLERGSGNNVETTHASLTVHRRGRYLQTLRPRVDYYAELHQSVAVPAVRTGLREDLYLVLAGWTDGGSQMTVKAFINPLASFLWLGGLVIILGGTIGLWPAAQRARAPTLQRRRRRIWSTAGILAGVVLVGMAGWALWVTPQLARNSSDLASEGAASPGQASRRPRVGEPARDVGVGLLDGSAFSLAEAHDRVVVLNFWSPDCQPCRDQLLDLQALWRDYRDRQVIIIGISFPHLAAEVEEIVKEYGITFGVGLDTAAPLTYGITGVPETFIVDQSGTVARVHIGPVTAKRLREDLDALLTP